MQRIMVMGLALLLMPLSASAQRHGERDGPPGSRQELEEKFRERFGELIKTRLSLSEAQMAKLEATNRRFEAQRRELFAQEREVREGLRGALREEENAATQDRVAELLDRALRLQRQRLDLVDAEQRELAQFMSPVQRAKYFGMQEQLRRRVEEMRHRSGSGVIDSLEKKMAPGDRPLKRREKSRPDSLRDSLR